MTKKKEKLVRYEPEDLPATPRFEELMRKADKLQRKKLSKLSKRSK